MPGYAVGQGQQTAEEMQARREERKRIQEAYREERAAGDQPLEGVGRVRDRLEVLVELALGRARVAPP